MKRTILTPLVLSLSLLTLLGSLAGCRSASVPTPPPEHLYTVTDGTLTTYNGTETEITLPEEVVRIGSGAFERSPAARSITRITLGAQVKEIHPLPFSGLPALRQVELSPENTSFRSVLDDRSGCSFLCGADEPVTFCFPGEDHTVELSSDNSVPYFYGENIELKLACQGAVFHLYRHTDNDDARRWYCRAIRWRDRILEFQESEDFNGGNYRTSIFPTRSGDVVFQRESGGSADAWLLTAGGPVELHPGDVEDGAVSLYPGEDLALRYRKIFGEYTDFDQLAGPPPGVDGSALYGEEGTVSVTGGHLVFTTDTQQTVSNYWAARET